MEREKHNLERLKGENPFKVPENYLDYGSTARARV